MKTTTVTLLAFAFVGCGSSCSGKPPVTWPSVVSCTEPAHADLLTAVQSILAAQDPEEGESSTIGDAAVRELQAMAQRHGAHVVACLVDEAVRSFEHAASVAPRQSTGIARSALREPTALEPPTGAEVDAQNRDEAWAAARGRDFLTRVAGTRIEDAGR